MIDGLVPICRQLRAPRSSSGRQNRPIGGVMRGRGPREEGGTNSADPADSLGPPEASQVDRIGKIGPSAGFLGAGGLGYPAWGFSGRQNRQIGLSAGFWGAWGLGSPGLGRQNRQIGPSAGLGVCHSANMTAQPRPRAVWPSGWIGMSATLGLGQPSPEPWSLFLKHNLNSYTQLWHMTITLPSAAWL